MRLYKKSSIKKQLEEKIAFVENERDQLKDKLEQIEALQKMPDGEAEILKNVLELAKIGHIIKLPDSNNLQISAIAKSILNLKEDQNSISTDEFLNLVVQEDSQQLKKILTENQHVSVLPNIDYKVINPSNEKDVRSIVSTFSFFPQSHPIIFLFTLMDVTRQEKARKDMLRLKEKLEENDTLKSIFLSNISHEIRIPINSIVGFSELLNIGNITPDEKREYINIIKNQSSTLLKLIDDIAELAKFETGDVNISKSPCNLNLLLNELLTSFSQMKKLQKKDHIELRLNIPDKNGILTYTDSGRLYQLMSNLISNAIKFTEKGFVEFGYTLRDDARIEFFVKDTGIGLSKEEQKYIFDRFSKIEETIARKYEGAGFGLSIAKGITKLLGGKIWIESEKGKGSAFSFYIPYEEIPGSTIDHSLDEEIAFTGYNWKGKLILIVEDDDVNYKFIETLLLENNAKILRAKNGNQAIELCKSINKIDLILMDIKMPEMDGYEATREIRNLNKTIPIIAQTAFASDENRQKCLEAGCNDQISKPIDIEELLTKINNYFI